MNAESWSEVGCLVEGVLETLAKSVTIGSYEVRLHLGLADQAIPVNKITNVTQANWVWSQVWFLWQFFRVMELMHLCFLAQRLLRMCTLFVFYYWCSN